MLFISIVLFLFDVCLCANLWRKGVVHYSINNKDYDLHSQDVITGTLIRIEKEICVKFFNAPLNYTSTVQDKILYIHNPDKVKDCVPQTPDYSGSVVNLVIGYKCLSPKDIARTITDMLTNSITESAGPNSYDLVKRFQEKERVGGPSTLLAPSERNFINANYYAECGALSMHGALPARRVLDDEGNLVGANLLYYSSKIWPLGVVMYGVEKKLRDGSLHVLLRQAILSLESDLCVLFEEYTEDDAVLPKNLLWFGTDGDDYPALGFREGNQTIKLSKMIQGVPGHAAHTQVLLLRAAGVPMMSNRYDRDHYVKISWNNVEKGGEVHLERLPAEAWVQQIPYDFSSITHAPVNYMCADNGGACRLGAATVQPLSDPLWSKSIMMGHMPTLSDSDKKMVDLLYGDQCSQRATLN